MPRSIKTSTLAFLVTLGITLLVWILRGVGLLTFMPGSVLWGLIFLCLLAAIVHSIR